MKSIFNNFKNGKPYIVDLPIPEINDNELLIQNKYSLISSGTEKFLIEFSKSSFFNKVIKNKDRVKQVLNKMKSEGVISTLRKVDNKLNQPFRLGYSSAGIVIGKGKNIKNYKIGDKVISNSYHSEIAISSENLCALIPHGVKYEEAIFCIPGSIALHSIRLAKPTIGENFLVIGLGLIGQLCMQILQANGCNTIGIDINPNKVKTALDNNHLALKFNKDVNKKIITNFDKDQVDGIIFTSTISEGVINYYAEICRKKARLIIVGNGNTSFSRDLFYKKELSLTVSCSYGPGRYDSNYEKNNLDYPIEYVRWTENRNFKSLLNLIKLKKINTENLLSKIFSIQKIDEAYQKIFNDNIISVGIKYEGKINLKKTIINKSKTIGNRNKIKINFIGSGNYTATTLLPILSKNPKITLDKIYSPSGVNSSILAKKNNFKISTTNIDKVLESSDTIFITTTHESHGKIFYDALKKNNNIYIEKPLATTKKDLITIQNNLNQKISRVYYVGFNRRFSSLNSKIISKIKNVGPIFINYNINASVTDTNHWTSNEKNGGRLIGEVCHFIDYCSFMLDSDIIGWKCTHLNNLNDNLVISLNYSNGSSVNINYITSGCDSFPKENIFFYYEKKIINLIDFKKINFYGFSFLNTSKKLIHQDKGQNNMINNFIFDIQNNIIDSININKIIKENFILLDIKDEIENS